MNISASAVCLYVDDPTASGAFLRAHFDFTEKFAVDGLASLSREDLAWDVVFLRRGLSRLPADQRDERAQGVILAFTVDDLDGELRRLERAGVVITQPLTMDEWGERSVQVREPNGVIVQLMDWRGPGSPEEWRAANPDR